MLIIPVFLENDRVATACCDTISTKLASTIDERESLMAIMQWGKASLSSCFLHPVVLKANRNPSRAFFVANLF